MFFWTVAILCGPLQGRSELYNTVDIVAFQIEIFCYIYVVILKSFQNNNIDFIKILPNLLIQSRVRPFYIQI